MSNEPKAGKGIDPELLAAYIDNRLSPEQRAVVEAQLASDPDSYAVLVDTLSGIEDDEIGALKVREPSTPPLPFAQESSTTRRRTWIIAGALASAATLVFALWMQPAVLSRLRGVDPLVAKLVEATENERYLDARLTGGFRYAPIRPVTRGRGDVSGQNLALLAAAGELQNAAKDNPTAAQLHAWGIAQLLVGEFDGAVETLENAVALEEENAAFLSDLSAAYHSRARNLDRPDDIPKALAFADRALVHDEALVEALHNRALALEGLSLRELAIETWRRLEQIGGEWSQEAAQRRKVLESKPSAGAAWLRRLDEMRLTGNLDVDGVEWEARQWLRREALPHLIDKKLAGAPVDRPFDLVARVVKALAPLDQFDEDWFRHVESLQPSIAVTEQQLARNFISFLQDAGSGAIVAQLPSIRLAAAEASRIGSPLAHWFDYFSLDARRASGSYAASSEGAAALAGGLSGRNYSTLTARLLWVQGVAQLQLNQSPLAAVSLASALDKFSSARDHVGRGRVLTQLSALQQLIGLDVHGWRSAVEAFGIAADHADATLRVAIGTVAAAVAIDRDYPEVAVAVLESQTLPTFMAVTAAERTQRDIRLAEALAKIGRLPEARHVLQRATESALAIEQPGVRHNARALEAQASARLSYQAGQPQRAREEANLALGQAIGTPFQRLTWHVISAASTEDPQESRAALLTAFDAIDDLYRGRVTLGLPTVERSAIVDAAEKVIRRLLDEGDVTGASTIADRAASAIGLWRSPHLAARTLSNTKTLPAGRIIFQYFTSRDSTYAWVHDTVGIKAVQLTISQQQLNEIAVAVRNAAERRDVEMFERLCSTAYQLLVAPLGQPFGPGDTLVVVAGGPLQGIPFAALRATAHEARLGAALPIAMAASLASARVADWIPVSGPALLVGSDAKDLAGWKPLAGTKQELDQVAGALAHPLRLMGSAATPHAVADGLSGRPSIFYYAGHSSLDFARPERSGLVLSESGGAWILTVEELARLSLSMPTTVILSTCSSARQLGRDAEASVSLASGFAALGARQSVAALWEVSDRVAPAIFAGIATAIIEGRDGRTAVQEAQLTAAGLDDEFLLGALGVVIFLS